MFRAREGIWRGNACSYLHAKTYNYCKAQNAYGVVKIIDFHPVYTPQQSVLLVVKWPDMFLYACSQLAENTSCCTYGRPGKGEGWFQASSYWALLDGYGSRECQVDSLLLPYVTIEGQTSVAHTLNIPDSTGYTSFHVHVCHRVPSFSNMSLSGICTFCATCVGTIHLQFIHPWCSRIRWHLALWLIHCQSQQVS